MEKHMNTPSYILSQSPTEVVVTLAEQILGSYSESAVTIISGPKVAMVQLRMRESVNNSVFNAGEILVTETRLELNGTFGFGMVIGNNPEHATALAVIDAALRMPEPAHASISDTISQLGTELHVRQQRQFAASASTKVEFDTF
jgi:alpha-D-ribose 1-methylphosphonate 5-triphosphate synthase subunit PhnG